MDQEFIIFHDAKDAIVEKAIDNGETCDAKLSEDEYVEIEDNEIMFFTPFTLRHEENSCNTVLKRQRNPSESKENLEKVKRRLFTETPEEEEEYSYFLEIETFKTDLSSIAEEMFLELQHKCYDEIILDVNEIEISDFLRANIINWIITINDEVYNPAILQTSVWYFDTSCSNSLININNYLQFAAACFWVAHQLYSAVPISNMGPTKLVEFSGESFNLEELLDAEKELRILLEYNLKPVIANDFLGYLCWSCEGEDNDNCLELAARFLCDAGQIVDKSLCGVPVSTISVAGVANACQLLNKADAMAKLTRHPLYQSTDTYLLNWVQSIQIDTVELLYSPEYDALLAFKELYTTPPQAIAAKILSAIKKKSVPNSK